MPACFIGSSLGLTTIRALVAGESVDYQGQSVELHGARLSIDPPPRTPVYLGALGPRMLELGGQLADGICLNWCSAEQVNWSRQLVGDSAMAAGRDPSEVKISEYIRICVDDDVDVARAAYTRAVMSYALGPLRQPGQPAQSYRAHFDRMGFAEDLAKIDEMRRENVPQEEIIHVFPERLLMAVGYYGKAQAAGVHLRHLAEGLDHAVVRVVAARPGIDATMAVVQACQPALVPA